MNAQVLAGHEWWLASSAAGIVAMILVSVSVGLGLANAAKLIPPRSRRTLIAIHEQTALAALVAIAAHGLLLLPDHWLHPGVGGIAVPFVIDYRPLRPVLVDGGVIRLKPKTPLADRLVELDTELDSLIDEY